MIWIPYWLILKEDFELCGLEPNPEQDKNPVRDEEMWTAIRQVDHFYGKLLPMPGAVEMFGLVYEKYGDRCEILTAVPKPKRGIADAADDKRKWVKKYLSEDVKVNIVEKEEKKNYVSGNGECVLIDDMKPNIDAWEQYGGIGILHKNSESTVKRLKEMNIL